MDKSNGSSNLDLVNDLLEDLRYALNASDKKEVNGLIEFYIFYTINYIEKVSNAYIILNKNGCGDASRILIRTVLDALFRAMAVKMKPELMYYISYGEYEDDKKLIRPCNSSKSYLTEELDWWEQFKSDYKEKYPHHSINEGHFKIYFLADEARLSAVYDKAFRYYSRYTHAAYRVTSGDLKSFDFDEPTMAYCIFKSLEILIAMGTPSPNYKSLTQRVNDLIK